MLNFYCSGSARGEILDCKEDFEALWLQRWGASAVFGVSAVIHIPGASPCFSTVKRVKRTERLKKNAKKLL